MSAVQWFSGPPPAVGWWPARYDYKRFARKYRFWNGEQWSNHEVSGGVSRRA